MTKNAVQTLMIHKANPDRATFAYHEAAAAGMSVDELDDAYTELEDGGFLVRSGQHVSFGQIGPRPCYRLTDAGVRAVPVPPPDLRS